MTTGRAIEAYGVLGVVGMLVVGVVRLLRHVAMTRTVDWVSRGGRRGRDPGLHGLCRGYRGFHLRFSPRVVARALVASDPRPIRSCFPLLHGTVCCDAPSSHASWA